MSPCLAVPDHWHVPCRPPTREEDPSSPKPQPSAAQLAEPRKVPGNAEVLANLDVAACAGLLEDACPEKPAWLNDAWTTDIRQKQEAHKAYLHY